LEKLQAAGKKILLLIWDNASWHVSKEVGAGSASTIAASRTAEAE